MTKDYIKSVLQKYYNHFTSKGVMVHAVALKGSQNYNLDDEESDIDANLVFIPTLQQLRSATKFKEVFEEGEVTCHNIYHFAEIVAKGNPQWVEVCNTEYFVGEPLTFFQQYKLNPTAVKGMIMEKVEAFSRLYPSREKYVKQFGYDPKQLHHIIRLYDLLASGQQVYKYSNEQKQHMLDIKRGRFPSSVEEAEALRDSYLDKLSIIYQQLKDSYKPQIIDFDYLDKEVLKRYKTYYN